MESLCRSHRNGHTLIERRALLLVLRNAGLPILIGLDEVVAVAALERLEPLFARKLLLKDVPKIEARHSLLFDGSKNLRFRLPCGPHGISYSCRDCGLTVACSPVYSFIAISINSC